MEQEKDIINSDLWEIVYSYFRDFNGNRNYYFTNHHLDSYNDFILNKIPQTLKENNPQIVFLNMSILHALIFLCYHIFSITKVWYRVSM